MIITVVNEGFANQVYRYCCAYATSKRFNQDLILIVQTSEVISDPFQLSEFNIACSDMFVTRSQLETEQLLTELSRRFKLVKVTEEDYTSFFSSDKIDEVDGVLLCGHFQSEEYIQDCIEEIREMLQFETKSIFLDAFSKEIEGKKSVGIHIRRGDFLYYNGLATSITYYKAAMCLMEKICGVGQAEYYVFSDDLGFAKEFLGSNDRIHYVNNVGHFRESIEELLALSMCQNHILTSASSFSRIADTLCACDNRVSIYDATGYEGMVDQKEYRIFIPSSYFDELSSEYSNLFVTKLSNEGNSIVSENDIINRCINANAMTEEEEIAIRIQKVKNEIEYGNYDIALGQVKKLWEKVFDTGSEQETIMHKLYFECLKQKQIIDESLIEAMYLPQIDYEHYFSEKQIKTIEFLKNNRCKIVIIPSRLYNPMWYEELNHIGVTFRRMGYDVTFMFWELFPGMEKYDTFNRKLRTVSQYIKTRGVNTLCKQIDLNQKIAEYGMLSSFLRDYCSDEKVVFFCKQKEVLEAIKEANIENSIAVFCDYSNPLDPGNYRETGDRIMPTHVSANEIVWSINNADYVVTHNPEMNTKSKFINIKTKEMTEKISISDFDLVADATVEKVYTIAKAIFENTINDTTQSDRIVRKVPLVSIIIPVYNRYNIILDTVESALAQTYPNIEIIICDNCSTDGTYQLLVEKYQNNPKVSLYQNEKNGGPVYNWQQCLKKANGEYLKILWSDDLISEDFVYKCVNVMEENKSIGFVYSSSFVFLDELPEAGMVVHSLGEKDSIFHKDVFYQTQFSHSVQTPVSPGCAMFRKKDVIIMSDIPNNLGVSSSMNGAGIDLLIFLLALTKYDCFYYIATPMSYFRNHKGSITMTNNLLKEYNVAKAYFCVNFEDGYKYIDNMKSKIMEDENIVDSNEMNILFGKYGVKVK